MQTSSLWVQVESCNNCIYSHAGDVFCKSTDHSKTEQNKVFEKQSLSFSTHAWTQEAYRSCCTAVLALSWLAEGAVDGWGEGERRDVRYLSWSGEKGGRRRGGLGTLVVARGMEGEGREGTYPGEGRGMGMEGAGGGNWRSRGGGAPCHGQKRVDILHHSDVATKRVWRGYSILPWTDRHLWKTLRPRVVKLWISLKGTYFEPKPCLTNFSTYLE